MADSAAPAKSPAKKAKAAKKPAQKPTHPTYSAMITAAVKDLKERGGSSRQAILKYILAKYTVGDEKKAASRLKIALVKGVASGSLKQVKGTGASGSFKIAQDDKPAKKVAKKTGAKKAAAKKPAAKKAGTPKKKAAKKPAAKKAGTPKKKAAKKPAAKKPAAKKPAAKKAKKSPKKAAKK